MIVISDANVIVYLWKGNLLDRVLDSVQVRITDKIFCELTVNTNNHTIPRDYPNLRDLILQHKHNPSLRPKIEIHNINTVDVTEEEHLKIYTELFKERPLDDGELEGIFLSIFSEIDFVTNDQDAIEYYNEMLIHSSRSKASSFEDFLENLKSSNIISDKEKQNLIEIKNN